MLSLSSGILEVRDAVDLYEQDTIAAIRPGGEDPSEGFKNLAVNGISVAVLSFLLQRDLASSARDRAIVKREEALARLQVGGAVKVGRQRGDGVGIGWWKGRGVQTMQSLEGCWA